MITDDEDEIKIVTRQETFNDLAVRELAKGKAACMCRLQFKRCTSSECKDCPAAVKFQNCVEQMSEYDHLRLDSYISKYYVIYSANPDKWMSHHRFLSYNIRILFTIMISFLIVGLFFGLLANWYMNPGDKPEYEQVTLRSKVVRTIIKTQSEIYDYNSDNQINCIDYACEFKLNWDEMWPEHNCILVRNLNPVTGMNHLFVRVYANGKINDIEPWAPDVYDYEMENVWGERYNTRYNYYGETKRWLEVK